MKTFQEFLNEALVPHPKALKTYVTNSTSVNHYLLDRSKGSQLPPLRHVDDFVHKMDQNTQSHTITSNKTVYHGTGKFHPGQEAAKNGGKVHLPNFTSTTPNLSSAEQFAAKQNHHQTDTLDDAHDKHVIKFNLKKGQHGVHHTSNHSTFGKVKEFVLPRNTVAKIDPTPTVTHSQHPKTGTVTKLHVWHATIENGPNSKDRT